MSELDIALVDRTVSGVLARTVARVPERTFIDIEERSLTYRQFDEEVGRYAAFLETVVGVSRDTKVALMLPNCLEFITAWFACARLGALYVPINTEYRGDILRHQLDKADLSVVVLDESFLDRILAVADRLPQVRQLVLRHCGLGDTVKSMVSPVSRFAMFDSRDRSGHAPRPDRGDVSHTELHSICFTSGTTGPSKGVLSTNCHVVSFSLDWIKVNAFTESDVIYTPLPLFHAIGSWLGVLPTVIAGARIAVVERFSATSFWADVRQHRATVAHGIFSVVPILLKQPPAEDDSDQPARIFYIGQQDPIFEQRFGCRIVNAYGSTETGAVTYTPFEEQAPPGSCGKVNLARFDVRLVDDAGQDVAVGEVGEVIVRPRIPHTMMEGYYNDAEGNQRALRDGWFHTGDNLRRDAAGWHFFVDRSKDAIRRRGENISSYEVEAVANQHAAVLETAAVAMASELGEDDVKLFVVRKPQAEVSHDELWAFCEQRMPGFWVPRYIEFIDVMPRTPNHKVMKVELRRDQLGGELKERVSTTRKTHC
jgi:crotonobetaine/carnitine-CoA ligase